MPIDFKVNVNVESHGTEKIDALEKQINSLKNNPIKIKVDVDKSALSNINLKAGTIKVKPTVDNSGINQLTKDFKMVQNLAKQMSATKIKIAGLDKTKNANEISVLSSQLKKMQSDYQGLMNTVGKSFNKDQLGNLNSILGNADDKVAQLKAHAKDLSVAMENATKPFNKLDASTASNRTLTWLKNNSKAAKEYGDRLREVAELQKTASNQDELKMYTKQANDLISEAKSKGLTGKSGIESIKNTFKTAGRFVSVYSFLNRIPHVVGQMANEVIRVDSAMTELRKVSSDSEDLQITNYFERATESAKKYGAQISEIINSAADWKRLGYSVADATKLADTTTLLEKVGDNMTQETSASGLISTLKGFQKTADEAQKIVDAANAISNTQPIDTAGLFEGLERSASSMNAANNSLEQTMGLITAANSVVQNPESVGTAFKTKLLRNCLYVQKCA